MDKLLIIADDFTGALDTGIQFTKMGIRARIVTEYAYDFSKLEEGDSLLVVNTDTRPLSAQEAYERVYELAKNARKAGFGHVYKKTDSGLRGNVGVELKAVLDAYEQNVLAFIPALPRLNRITRGGIQYIDGIPVKDSVFGKDPFEPVRYSDVAEIIRSQTDLHVVKIQRDAYDTAEFHCEEKTVLLFDAETEEDLAVIANRLKDQNAVVVNAGCAGFAAEYRLLLKFEKGNPHGIQHSDGLLALCGSVNGITVRQLDYAGQHGFKRNFMQNEQKLEPDFMKSDRGKQYLDDLYQEICSTDKYMLDTLDREGFETAEHYRERMNWDTADVRFRISTALGLVAAEMIRRGLNYTISMTGGDTLMGFMRVTGVTELAPICEIGKGAVLSAMRWNGKRIQVISKSGGFGEEDIFEQMYETIMEDGREGNVFDGYKRKRL